MTPSPQPIRASKSLKLSLILPFVALIALLTSTLGMLWYWTGSNTVSALSEQVMQEKAERIAATEAKREEARRVDAPALEAWDAYIEARKAKWSAPHLADH